MHSEPCGTMGSKSRVLNPEPVKGGPNVCWNNHQFIYHHGPRCPMCKKRREYACGLVAAGIIVGMLIVRIVWGA